MTEPYPKEGLPLDQARALILQALEPLALLESLPLPECLGRTVAEAVHAPEAVPGFRASIMDGYALAGSEQPALGEVWQLVGRSAAGAPFLGTLQPGQAVRVLTGALVPEGSGRVVPQELVEASPQELRLIKACGANPWIRSADEETAAGGVLAESGLRLGVAEVARLSSCGIQCCRVFSKPRVGLLISGDELLPPGQPRQLGEIWESNSTLLRALLERLGYGVAVQRVVGDQPEPLRQALLTLAEDCDVVVSTGGVSAGDTDWIRPLVAELGEVRFWKLFLKPGRPLAWGTVAGTPFFGLPGNPVAAAVTALQLLWPALQRLEGAQVELLPRLRVALEQPLRRGAGRPELARASLVVAEDGRLLARVAGSQASSRIGSLAGADLLLEIPAELGSLEAGAELWAQLLRLPIF